MTTMSKTQRWDWAITLRLEELNNEHLEAAYKLNWDSLCKFDSCRKNCKRVLCLACFDKSWVESDSANNSGYDNFDTINCVQKRTDLKSFVGLKNLGATCYVNCLLQLWFHNPALRKAIYQWNREGNSEPSQDEITEVPSPDKNETQQKSPRMQSKRHREDEPSTPLKKTTKTSSASNRKEETPINTCRQVAIVDQPQPSKAENEISITPIEQLQLIFARLQFTNKKSIDPFGFIESLNLNAAEQQDAQEFGSLFMEFLEKKFANQRDTFVSKILQNQFRGRSSYVTICDSCRHSSVNEENFYELHLSIQNLETLHECLNEFFRPCPLDGGYHCSQCGPGQSAHRRTVLKSLPLTLNLQLLRFVYDVQRNTRQKLNSHIIFPEILDMSQYLGRNNSNHVSSNGSPVRSNRSNIYILSAVLIHRGSSPHSGHYIAHIKDRITKDWYKFNDDNVEKIGPQLQVSTDGENITIVEDKATQVKVLDAKTGKITRLESKSLKSKTAYMLVYQAQDNEALSYPSDNSEDWQLPDHLQTAVAEENSRCDEIFESIEIAKQVDQQIINTRKKQIKMIYEKLVCRDQSEEFEFIDKSWLQQWLTNSSTSIEISPINNSHLLCIHDKLDFRKLDQVKCIRSEGADLLYKEFGGGPRLKDAMCRQCVELEVKLIQLKERLKEDQKFITSQAKFKIDAGYDFADAYIVGKNSYRDWQALVMAQFKKSNPELCRRKHDGSQNQNSSDDDDQKTSKENVDASKGNTNNEDNSNSESDDEAIERFVFNSDILCDHNQLLSDPLSWRIVPKEVWTIFKHYFGNDPDRPLIERNANTIMCAECKRQEVEQQEIGDHMKQVASKQKARLPDLFHNRKRAGWCSMQPGDEYYALDRQFLTKWQKFIRNPCTQERPTEVKNKEKLVCSHDKSLHNSENSNPILSDCPFVLVTRDELDGLKEFYPVDNEIRFSIDMKKAEEKLKVHLATHKVSPKKTILPDSTGLFKHPDVASSGSDRNNGTSRMSVDAVAGRLLASEIIRSMITSSSTLDEDVDLSEIDWSECVVSSPGFCSECHEALKQDQLKKMLNYESATIYITKVENPHGPQNNSAPSTNGGGSAKSDNRDGVESNRKQPDLQVPSDGTSSHTGGGGDTDHGGNEDYPFKRRRKGTAEDEANDFVPPGAAKQPPQAGSPSSSILRRTTRRNRNREQAYTIKPTQTLLQLKKEIFSRCQVLPVDQRLFLDGVLLDDNNKTMSELSIIPSCSLKLEVDRPVGDTIDLIEDEPMSSMSCAQLETGFKGSLLLSNSHL